MGRADGTDRLVILGGGGFAREAIWLAREASSDFDVIGLLDDSSELQGTQLSGVPVIGRIDDWLTLSQACFVVAVGSPRSRRAIVEKMMLRGSPRFATLIHRSVHRSEFVTIGEGSMVAAGCVLTTDIQIGRHVIVNINSTVGHDVVIGDYSTVAPVVAVSGNVRLGAGSEIGTGSCLKQGVDIGVGSMVGMGSVVTKSVPDYQLAMGAPARVVRPLDVF